MRRSRSQRGRVEPVESSLDGLSVQPALPARRRTVGVASTGGAHRGTAPLPPAMVNLGRLRVAVATADPALAVRIAGVVEASGHEVAVATASPYDAMEAAFSRQVEVLVLDQQLQRLPAAEVASLVHSVGTDVMVVVLRGGETAIGDDLRILDPAGPGFDSALAEVLANPTGTPPAHEGRRAG